MFRTLALACVAVALLASCTPAAAPAPTDAPSSSYPAPSSSASGAPAPGTSAPSGTPTAVPTDSADAPAATTLVMHARSVSALTADGDVISTAKVSEPASAVIKKLTAVFGEAPAKGTDGATTTYSWGGFTVRVWKSRVSEAEGGTEKLFPLAGFEATKKSALGIRLGTVRGIAVGDSAKTLAKKYPKAVRVLCDCTEQYFRFDETTVGQHGDFTQTQSVLATASSPTGKVTTIAAPSANYE